MNTQQLAALMGVSESDAQGFVDCLRVWTDKGYTVEQAIERNLAAWNTLGQNYADGQWNAMSRHHDSARALKAVAVEAFYPQAVAQ